VFLVKCTQPSVSIREKQCPESKDKVKRNKLSPTSEHIITECSKTTNGPSALGIFLSFPIEYDLKYFLF
jgi:hypothetical protein